MTQKELMYLEDAVGHETSIIKIIGDSIKKLQDEELITFMENDLKKHTKMKEKLMHLMEDKANE